MPAALSKTGRALRGIGLGLAATLLVLAVHRTDTVRFAELRALDLRFRLLPTIGPNDRIIHVDLDDKAMDQIGRWPWPRRRLAQLVDALNECGARWVLLDVLLPHPQAPRYVKEGHTDLYLDDDAALLNPEAPPVPVLDDVELSRSLAASPNLFLATYADIAEPGRRSQYEPLVESLAAIVTTRPSITCEAAAAETGQELRAVQDALATAKQRGFERRIRALLRDDPNISRREVSQRLFGRAETRTENDDIARRVYLHQRALNVMQRFVLPGENGDGVVRRIPLLIQTDRGVFPQLALALAAEALTAEHGGPCRISASKGRIVLSFPDGFVRSIPVDRRGFMLINWSPAESERHISAVAAAGVWDSREALRRNTDLARLACLEMARLLDRRALLKLFAEADETWQKLHAARQQRQAALLFSPASVPPEPDQLRAEEAALETKIEQACKELIEEVDSFYLSGAQAAAQAAEDPQVKTLRELRALVRRADHESGPLRQRLAEAKQRLRERIAGKIVLVGSTSTGAADFVPTPVHERAPGITVHANILNTILTGRFVAIPSGWFSALLVLLAGGLVAALTSTRGPVQAALLLGAAVVGYAAADGGVWKAWTYWMIAASPIAAMLATFAVVTAYRQLTEQRHKRQITNVFKQYLSPAMVDRLVADPTQAALGGQRRQLSCLFSDLAGFTSLSERLGPEATVNLLNRYLDRVGEILQVRHGGTLSKYEGDGVFAFFGAPVPQHDHAARALHAALDCQDFLPEFNRQLKQEALLPDWAELSVRAGITTGEVLVGNMGSTRRIAYTAIGDSVNLAARLEPANKFFGTRILVNEEAWRAGADGLAGRPLGKVLVVGKTEPVSIWEPLARAPQADQALQKLIEDFTRGVASYAAGNFEAARDSFRAILARGDDAAARTFLQLCEQAMASPPADFDGVIRLTEK